MLRRRAGGGGKEHEQRASYLQLQVQMPLQQSLRWFRLAAGRLRERDFGHARTAKAGGIDLTLLGNGGVSNLAILAQTRQETEGKSLWFPLLALSHTKLWFLKSFWVWVATCPEQCVQYSMYVHQIPPITDAWRY